MPQIYLNEKDLKNIKHSLEYLLVDVLLDIYHGQLALVNNIEEKKDLYYEPDWDKLRKSIDQLKIIVGKLNKKIINKN
jgi:hypothetical protein